MIRPGETVDQWRDRMNDKAAKARGFIEREQAALVSQVNAKKVRTAKPTRRRVLNAPSELDLTRAIGITRQNERPRSASMAQMGAPRTRPEHCLGCEKPVYRATSKEPRPEGAKRLMGRGLCTTCYSRARKAEAAAS